MDRRSRPKNKLDLAVQDYLGQLSFHWEEHVAEPQKFRTPTTIIIILKLVIKANMVEFGILGPQLANNCIHVGGKTEGEKDKVGFTLQKGFWKQSV